MKTLSGKIAKVFQEYEIMTPESWRMYDFEREIIRISGELADYKNVQAAILLAKKLGVFPITVNAYIQKHIEAFGSQPQ